MSDAIKRAGDREAEARVERFQLKVRDLLRTVEEDPRDLTAARKYMGVYLQGARDATVKFADVYAREQRPRRALGLHDAAHRSGRSFNAKTKTLLLDDRSDLNIEIDVLRDRLAREGVRLNAALNSKGKSHVDTIQKQAQETLAMVEEVNAVILPEPAAADDVSRSRSRQAAVAAKSTPAWASST